MKVNLHKPAASDMHAAAEPRLSFVPAPRGVRQASAQRPSQAFLRCGRMDRERMDAGLQFGGKRRIDHAVALQPALSTEGFRHDIDPEMGFAARPVSGMTLVTVGFVLDLEAQRREGRGQLLRNGRPDAHEP
jgi:hypothetical protein